MARWFLVVETSGLLQFWEEKLNFKFSFMHNLRIMHLNVKEVELKIRENEKCKIFFWNIC